jgi:hypothetical protein
MSLRPERSREGYLLIDERACYGGKYPFEAPTRRCSHCHRVVILNLERSRERGYCWQCDAYICDDCARVLVASGECRPLDKLMDDLKEAAVKGLPQPDIIIRKDI